MASTTATPTRRNSRLQETWQDFQRALRSVREPFNPFSWIWRLFLALVDHIYIYIGLADLVQRHDFNRKQCRACIPIFAMCLIGLVVVSYPLSIRHKLIQPRWCGDSSSSSSAAVCKWIYLHDCIVIYFAFMILYHYISAIFTSPGVVLPPIDVLTKQQPAATAWSAIQGQGGVLGWNAVSNTEHERQRVRLYGPLSLLSNATAAATSTSSGSSHTPAPAGASPTTFAANHYFPSVHASYCEKCQIIRPPRCHHCRICNRCVLQYDHHCIWVNNCIGYNNYRHFVLLLLFLMLGCWYGIGILLLPFYEPLRQQIREKGFHWTYENGTGFLDLPTPAQLLQMMRSGDGLPVKIVVDLVYPLLLGVGAILSGFLGFHLQYILKARTTLEHKIILQDALVNIYRQGQQQLQQLSSHTPAPPTTVTTTATSISTANNPFDQGYYKNLQQILGHNLLWILVPVSISPPAPYIPSKNTATDTPGIKTTTTTRSRKEC